MAKLLLLALAGLLCQAQYNQYNQKKAPPKADPYKVLGLEKDATQKEIRNAYRKMSLKFHPDKNKSPDAKVKMNEVSEAYEMVGDPDKKLIYDEFGDGEKFTNRWQYEQNQRRKGQAVSKKGFYSGSEDVQTLTVKNYYSLDKSKGRLVEFYAPWCVHCQDMVSEYKKTAILLDGEIIVAAVNCEAEKQVCNQQGIRSYPTLRFFLPLKPGEQQEMEEYNGDHSADALYGFVKQSLSTAVVKLTNNNFNQVTDKGELWLIDFSAGRWCGPCTMLKGPLKRIAPAVEGKAKVGIVDCDSYGDLCQRMGVTYFPQLRLYYKDGPEQGELMEVNNQFPAAGMLDIFERLLNILWVEPASAGGESDAEQPVLDHNEL